MGSTAFGQPAPRINLNPSMTTADQPQTTHEFFATVGARSGGSFNPIISPADSKLAFTLWEKSVPEQLGLEEVEEPVLMSYRREDKRFVDIDSFYSIRFVASQNALYDPTALRFAFPPLAPFIASGQGEAYLPMLDNVSIAAVPIHSSGLGMMSALASFGALSAFRRKRRAQV